MESVAVLNFTGVYERENFYKDMKYEWIDCSDLTGVNGFCDDEAMAEIEARTGSLKSRIRFIDGGNFHYLSCLLLRKMQEPFTLVVFDHHTDMKPSLFEGLLSCGCWIKRALDSQPYLKRVIIIGVADELADSVEPEYEDRVYMIPESAAAADDAWLDTLKREAEEAVYLSVDKDAFGREEVVTDWDQGTMTLDQLERAFLVLKDFRILGADVCGEAERDDFVTGQMSVMDEQNNAANRRILHMLQILLQEV